MKVSELYRKLLRVHVDGPDDEIGGGTVQTVEAGTNITVDSTDPAHPVVAASGGGGGGIEPGEPLTQIVGDDGGVGYEGSQDVPVFAFRYAGFGATNDCFQLWIDGEIFIGDGLSSPHPFLQPGGGTQFQVANGLIRYDAATNKLAFFNKAEVDRPAAIANATDAGSAITQLNLLLAAMRALGLIAT